MKAGKYKLTRPLQLKLAQIERKYNISIPNEAKFILSVRAESKTKSLAGASAASIKLLSARLPSDAVLSYDWDDGGYCNIYFSHATFRKETATEVVNRFTSYVTAQKEADSEKQLRREMYIKLKKEFEQT